MEKIKRWNHLSIDYSCKAWKSKIMKERIELLNQKLKSGFNYYEDKDIKNDLVEMERKHQKLKEDPNYKKKLYANTTHISYHPADRFLENQTNFKFNSKSFQNSNRKVYSKTGRNLRQARYLKSSSKNNDPCPSVSTSLIHFVTEKPWKVPYKFIISFVYILFFFWQTMG
jgi:hypothetical protein